MTNHLFFGVPNVCRLRGVPLFCEKKTSVCNNFAQKLNIPIGRYTMHNENESKIYGNKRYPLLDLLDNGGINIY